MQNVLAFFSSPGFTFWRLAPCSMLEGVTFTDVVKDQKLHFTVKHVHIDSRGVRVMVLSEAISGEENTTKAIENGVLEVDGRDGGWVWLEKSPKKIAGDCAVEAIALYHQKLNAEED